MFRYIQRPPSEPGYPGGQIQCRYTQQICLDIQRPPSQPRYGDGCLISLQYNETLQWRVESGCMHFLSTAQHSRLIFTFSRVLRASKEDNCYCDSRSHYATYFGQDFYPNLDQIQIFSYAGPSLVLPCINHDRGVRQFSVIKIIELNNL